MKTKRIHLSPEMLSVFFTMTGVGPGGAPSTRELPRDAVFAGAAYDAEARAWAFDFTHPTFNDVEEGKTPQRFAIRHRVRGALDSFLRGRANTPFAWGTHDCALFAADGILAMTARDIAGDFRGKYSDEAGAMAAIKSITGGETIADAAAWCAEKNGLAQWPHPLKAQMGDLVVYTDPDTKQLVSGLVHLNGRHIVAQGPTGLKLVSISLVERAWHV